MRSSYFRIAFLLLIFFFASGATHAQKQISRRTDHLPGNNVYRISWASTRATGFSYTLTENGEQLAIGFPTMEINGKETIIRLDSLHMNGTPETEKNNVQRYTCEGVQSENRRLHVRIEFRVAPDNPVLRFRYQFLADTQFLLTKRYNRDRIEYLHFKADPAHSKELSFSTYDERFHATHLTEQIIDARYFEDSLQVMGPAFVSATGHNSFLVAYEHGSQYGDPFLQFQLHSNGQVGVAAVKGNYVDGESVNNYHTPWMEVCAVPGKEADLARQYRTFILDYLPSSPSSRDPAIFYNTWGRQEKQHFRERIPYLASQNLSQILKEIDRAHAIGIEVFVIDVGWFASTGDWQVNLKSFPDTLQQVKRKLDKYGMKLGLWFNPTMAAVSSRMYASNLANRMSWNDSIPPPALIWESPMSSGLCLVSTYWEQFADKLISLVKQLGVSYFKWDGIAQYGCNDAHHLHGSEKNTPQERADNYAFLQPAYMSKIIDRVSAQCPGVIVDFDISEPGRAVGLEFLSSGKYFILNNGPYFHNFDLAKVWESPLANGNANMFVNAGPARGWFLRSVLDYDKWIPSNLFLTHYLPDGAEGSHLINVGSMILGQNGIWGEILNLSDSGTLLFNTVLSKYKMVRNDIERASIINTGSPGESPEIYEKINPETGRGCIVIFANGPGDYSYLSKHRVDGRQWKTTNASTSVDKEGRVIVRVHATEGTAAILFFGTE